MKLVDTSKLDASTVLTVDASLDRDKRTDAEEDEEVEAHTSPNQARTIDPLQQLLSGLENQQPMPSGPALLKALRMCWIGG